LGEGVARFGTAGPAEEFVAIGGAEQQRTVMGAAAWHGLDLVVAADDNPIIIFTNFGYRTLGRRLAAIQGMPLPHTTTSIPSKA
jgi:hypothetical protein